MPSPHSLYHTTGDNRKTPAFDLIALYEKVYPGDQVMIID